MAWQTEAPGRSRLRTSMVIHTEKRQPRFIRVERYQNYLKSDHWQNLRKAKLKEAGYVCQRCGAKDCMLQVHHKVYRKSWLDTELFELEVLCDPCHDKEHAPKVRLAANAYHPLPRKKRNGWSKAKRKMQRNVFMSRVARYGYDSARVMSRLSRRRRR